MYTKDQLKKLIFLDIETTSNYIKYSEFVENHPREVKFWQRKAKALRKDTIELQDKSDADLSGIWENSLHFYRSNTV